MSLVFLPKEGIQQFFVLIALDGDVIAIGAGEVEEVAFGDDVLTAGFIGLQPAAVQPAADGVHRVAEELCRFPLREGIGLAAPFIGEKTFSQGLDIFSPQKHTDKQKRKP